MPRSRTAHPFELFETESGGVVAFLGSFGGGGVLCLGRGGEWVFHPNGSLVWDSLHQTAYRQGRMERLEPSELERRGISPPPAERYAGARSMEWKDNFTSEIALDEVPAAVTSMLPRSPSGEAPVYLVLCEDRYETALGDGRFLYPACAFLDEGAARERLRTLESDEASSGQSTLGYRYTLKTVRLRIDEARRALTADLNIEPYEHFSLSDVLRLLAADSHAGGIPPSRS